MLNALDQLLSAQFGERRLSLRCRDASTDCDQSVPLPRQFGRFSFAAILWGLAEPLDLLFDGVDLRLELKLQHTGALNNLLNVAALRFETVTVTPKTLDGLTQLIEPCLQRTNTSKKLRWQKIATGHAARLGRTRLLCCFSRRPDLCRRAGRDQRHDHHADQ